MANKTLDNFKTVEGDRVVSRSYYRRKDHKNFYLFHSIFKSSSSFFILLILGFLIFFSIRQSAKVDYETGMTTIIMVWTMTAVTFMMIPLILIIRINDVVKKETDGRRESTDTVEVTKVKILKSCDKIPGKVVISWHQLESVCETKKYIYLYTGERQGIFIVKKDIIEGNVEVFRKLAFENMRKQKGKVAYRGYFTRIKKHGK